MRYFQGYCWCYCKLHVLCWAIHIFSIPEHCHYIMAVFVFMFFRHFFIMRASIILRRFESVDVCLLSVISTRIMAFKAGMFLCWFQWDRRMYVCACTRLYILWNKSWPNAYTYFHSRITLFICKSRFWKGLNGNFPVLCSLLILALERVSFGVKKKKKSMEVHNY